MNNCNCEGIPNWSLVVVEAFDIWEMTIVKCTNCNKELIKDEKNETT